MQTDLEALDDEAERIVKNMGIPPCPAILTQLLNEMRNEEPDFVKTGRLISRDVGLAAAMLNTVNSSFYGLQTKARSVPQALALLGLRNVAQLVTGLLLRQVFPLAHSAAMEEFWASSSSIAVLTGYLVRSKVKGVNFDDAYTFALFRDCGIPAMLTALPAYRPPPTRVVAGNITPPTELEYKQHGINHASTGYYLARGWLLPDATCQAVLHHHDFTALRNGGVDIPAASVRLIMLALAAECLFAIHSTGTPCPEWVQNGNFALQQLGITQAELEASVQEIDSSLSVQ